MIGDYKTQAEAEYCLDMNMSASHWSTSRIPNSIQASVYSVISETKSNSKRVKLRYEDISKASQKTAGMESLTLR